MTAALGPSLQNVILAIAIPLIPTVARVIRANTLALREQPFVEAAKSIGMSETRIALRHVLPNTIAPLIVLATAQARLDHPDRSVAVVPRPRHSRALSVLGPHAVGIRRRICPRRAVARDLPRHRDQSRGVRHQLVRRCVARHPRSEAARLMTETQATETVLDVKNLQTVFFTNSGLFRAVDDVSFSVRRGETLAIVGEIRLRQERQRAVDHAPGARSARPHRRRFGHARRYRSAQARRCRDARHQGQPHLDDLPGADDLAQSR